MAAEIVPDVFCEKLLCSQCDKYLSVSPVKLYDGGKVKCGRCWDPTDDGKVSSWYTMVMRNSLFKCVNRFDGCRQVLKPSEVLEHEKSCNAGNHQCQECFSFDGTLYEMVRHYKKMHPFRIINENEEILIEIVAKDLDKPIQRNYLVIKEDVVYFVLTRLSANKFDFNAVLAKENSDDIYCNFELFMDHVSMKLPNWQGRKCATLEHFGGNYNSIDGNFSIVKILKLLPTFIQKTAENLDSKAILKSINADNPVLERKDKRENVQTVELDENKTVKSISENSKLKEVDLQNSLSKIGSKQCKPQEHDEHENAYNEVAPDILSDRKKAVKLSNHFKRNFPDDTISECGTILILSTGEKINLLCLNCEEYYGINLFKCDSGEHWLCKDCNHYCSLCKKKTNSPNLVTDYLPKLLLILFPCVWKLCKKYVMGFEKMDHESNCDLSLLKCPTCFIICSLPKMKVHVTTCHAGKYFDQPIRDLYPYLRVDTESVFYFMNNCHIIRIKRILELPVLMGTRDRGINYVQVSISSKFLTNSLLSFYVIFPALYKFAEYNTIQSDPKEISYDSNNHIYEQKQPSLLLVYLKNV